MPYKDPAVRAEYHKRYMRERYAANSKAQIDLVSRRRAELKACIDEIKTSSPCTDCGQFFPAVCMDFDHLGDKVFNIGNAIRRFGWNKIEAEIAKCELVCANCHRLRTSARGGQVR